jgi:hypothetical protein
MMSPSALSPQAQSVRRQTPTVGIRPATGQWHVVITAVAQRKHPHRRGFARHAAPAIQTGDRWQAANALYLLGKAEFHRRGFNVAKPLLDRCSDIHKNLRIERDYDLCLATLAYGALSQHETGEAEALLARLASLCAGLSPRCSPELLDLAAAVCIAKQMAESSAVLLVMADAIRQRTRLALHPLDRLAVDRTVAMTRQQLGAAAWLAFQRTTDTITVDGVVQVLQQAFGFDDQTLRGIRTMLNAAGNDDRAPDDQVAPGVAFET